MQTENNMDNTPVHNMTENEALRYLMKFYRYSLKKTNMFH